MNKQESLKDNALFLNRFYLFYNFKQSLLIFFCFFFSVLGSSGVALYFFPENLNIILLSAFILYFPILCYQVSKTNFRKKIHEKNLALFLEVTHGDQNKNYLANFYSEHPLNSEEKISLQKELKNLQKNCNEDLTRNKKQTFLSFFFFFGVTSYLFFQNNFFFTKNLLEDSFDITVLKGVKNSNQPEKYKLHTGKTALIELKEDNLVELTLSSSEEENKIILLDENKHFFQTILLQKKDLTETEYRASFSLTKNLHLTLESLPAKTLPLASFFVDASELPEVFISPEGPVKDPWPSNEPISLRIEVKAKKELSLVKLHIKSDSDFHSREIAELSTRSVKNISFTEIIYLDQFLSDDFGKITLQAEAEDVTNPVSQKGFSNQITLNLISVYGEYQKALSLLKEMRENIANSEPKGKMALDKKSLDKLNELSVLSEKTPYFDHQDRKTLDEIENLLKEYAKNLEEKNLQEASSLIAEFLSEHETLDDRERDRDFFVAMRSLSHLVEEGGVQKKNEILESNEQTLKFLKDRFKRWQERVSELQDKTEIPSWESIEQKKPFQQSLEKISSWLKDTSSFDSKKIRNELSTTVTSYENWIQELETAEDKAEEEQAELAEQQLVSIRKQLAELKKRQDEISIKLDQSENNSQETLKTEWPITRLKQNTNLSAMDELIQQLSSLNFSAGKRLDSAKEAMAEALSSGEKQNFRKAETSSDSAGRYLREAMNKSEERQTKNRERKRKQTGSQEYHGQAIHRGDIEIRHDYEIDKQYREEILKEFESNSAENYHDIQERYLKKIIR